MIILLLVVLYLIIYISIIRCVFSDINSLSTNSTIEAIKISVVIAAKNEAENLNELVTSLSQLDFPDNDYEVILVDDNSEDDTSLIAGKLFSAFQNYSIVKSKNKKFEGKRGALDYGISIAKHPYIVITDADCRPEKNWLKAYSNKFKEGYDFILGLAPFFQSKFFANKISCYENFRNSILSFAAVNFGLAYSTSARNFGFKKDSFFKIGGYKNTIDTIGGDDDLLLREAVKNKLKIGIIITTGSFVYSDSKKSFKEYFSQRARHTQTSFHYPLKQKSFLSVWHTLNILFLLSPLLIPLNIIFFIPFTVKMLLDVIVSKSYQKKFGYRFSLVESIYLQILYELFLIVHIIKSKTTEIKWK